MAASGGMADKVISMDDFVIPRQPSCAALTVETGASLVDYHCRWVSCVEHIEVLSPK